MWDKGTHFSAYIRAIRTEENGLEERAMPIQAVVVASRHSRRSYSTECGSRRSQPTHINRHPRILSIQPHVGALIYNRKNHQQPIKAHSMAHVAEPILRNGPTARLRRTSPKPPNPSAPLDNDFNSPSMLTNLSASPSFVLDLQLCHCSPMSKEVGALLSASGE